MNQEEINKQNVFNSNLRGLRMSNGSLLARLGALDFRPFGGKQEKPRHEQILDEAKARHPEWQVKRLTSR